METVVPYSLDGVEQFDPAIKPPTTPADAARRERWARHLGVDATVFGLPAVLQYAEMYAQAVDEGNPRFTGFARFAHQRRPAGPEFDAFRVPTVDNLYSTAFVDLSSGPARVRIPPMGERYYTLNFQDAYANATNLSSRTVGAAGGDFVVVPPHLWEAAVPTRRAKVFRVASRSMWILMRISKRPEEANWSAVHALQDAVEIVPVGAPADVVAFPPATPGGVRSDPEMFFAALDHVMRTNGWPLQEVGLVDRYRAIGVGGSEPFDAAALPAEVRRGLAVGHAAALDLVWGSRGRTGTPLPGIGWTSSDPGRSGYDHLGRAVTNLLGLGGNVAAENKPFVTFVDAGGATLDGGRASYTWHADVRPPGRDIWSLTLYDVSTGQVVDNPLERYKLGSGVDGFATAADGSFTVTIQHDPPADTTNWLPAPAAPFFLAIRTWEPDDTVLSGGWIPEAVQRVVDA